MFLNETSEGLTFCKLLSSAIFLITIYHIYTDSFCRNIVDASTMTLKTQTHTRTLLRGRISVTHKAGWSLITFSWRIWTKGHLDVCYWVALGLYLTVYSDMHGVEDMLWLSGNLLFSFVTTTCSVSAVCAGVHCVTVVLFRCMWCVFTSC